MEHNTASEAQLVPPVLDEAELIGFPGTETPVIESEPVDELNPPLDTAEQQGLSLETGTGQPPLHDGASSSLPQRPGLRRENSVPTPAPLHLPPPAPPAPPSDASQPPDSLSLMQLRRLVDNLPRVEPTPYAFAYEDASSFEDELEEWFSYSVEEQAMILKTHESFVQEWNHFLLGERNSGRPESDSVYWEAMEASQQRDFVGNLLRSIKQHDSASRLIGLEALLYIMLGCWHESAGRSAPGNEASPVQQNSGAEDRFEASAYEKSGLQIHSIRTNVQLIVECGGLQNLVDAMRAACLKACGVETGVSAPREDKEAERREVWCAMTAVYVVLEVARVEEKENGSLLIRNALLALEKPGLFMLLLEIISKLRWDESINLQLSKVCLLIWKTILVSFGGLSEVDKAKDAFRDVSLDSADDRGQPLITASPLDYHLFRQEISSKYPAYNPPPPLFPLEPENNSILPPLKNHPNKIAGNHIYGSGLGNANGSNTSIFHQPVHIATPAPSPPPSPAGPGGKGGKKQNYQTNQLFPFLYPPLDETSNNLGGKGSTDLQDVLVGRKWQGSDIPTSILEAAELFAKRMRATRAMKQLWDERVQYMKYERGWSGADEDLDIADLSLEPKENSKKESHPPGSMEERMELVEECYRTSLPGMQSLIIVLIKGILAHVTALVTQSTATNGLQSGFQFQENQNGATTNGVHTNGVNGHHASVSTNDELDAMRTQEILDKAVSGILILMLKWFKISHILKYEYITQLLVDSSYVPLILKLLQLQEIEKVVNSKCEQEELNFFHFCRAHSHAGISESPPPPIEDASSPDSDSDSAIPPPIRMRRSSPTEQESVQESPAGPLAPPEVDELGFPLSELPKEPITNFSWRAFFTTINYLRIMQKICKNKAHRNLMLVSYKSSQFLRKSLKVPQKELRLYTLKLFKNQVPYCGRKWRQSNMRVITAVYLHCRPELRDDWLAGSDVDAEVDESVPLEQALRALTHWWNLKRYPEGMGADKGVLGEEQDFFRRELEKMDWGTEAGVGSAVEGEEEGGWDAGENW
ncbi:protein required for hyphal anastomosis [Lophiostoma macrostomum CBS 122681]|uniref:Protein required for hyphal anastomosis n=1 Tax=Lophiostoma macrostomum CBS 122681 TaxID=1314788 RepID=A0A6A6TLB2_9PLEO|nr:protein required for hyphal anastomosis [Lophiostoma macrostomum CBS 122681]